MQNHNEVGRFEEHTWGAALGHCRRRTWGGLGSHCCPGPCHRSGSTQRHHRAGRANPQHGSPSRTRKCSGGLQQPPHIHATCDVTDLCWCGWCGTCTIQYQYGRDRCWWRELSVFCDDHQLIFIARQFFHHSLLLPLKGNQMTVNKTNMRQKQLWSNGTKQNCWEFMLKKSQERLPSSPPPSQHISEIHKKKLLKKMFTIFGKTDTIPGQVLSPSRPWSRGRCRWHHGPHTAHQQPRPGSRRGSGHQGRSWRTQSGSPQGLLHAQNSVLQWCLEVFTGHTALCLELCTEWSCTAVNHGTWTKVLSILGI